MDASPEVISLSYLPHRLTGRFERTSSEGNSSAWERLRARLAAEPASVPAGSNAFEMPWPLALQILRELGTRSLQTSLNFRFRPDESAQEAVRRFAEEVRAAREARGKLSVKLTESDIRERLASLGFIRQLKSFQVRDLQRLLTLPNGANFSVPGAGKTTVTLALHLLAKGGGEHLLVVAPKAAFSAWRSIVSECVASDAPGGAAEQFTFLEGNETENDRALRSGKTRFVVSYDLMVRQQQLIANYLARQPVHLVLDEAHRMKAGGLSQRGAYLLSIATLPARRDILTGTPMPQGPGDLASQLAFLWPGQGLDMELARGTPPRTVLGDLFVRTTKKELELPKAERFYHPVDMSPPQRALYSIVSSATLRQLTETILRRSEADFMAARSSVMRLLQLSVNPVLALRSIASAGVSIDSAIVEKVLDEGASMKMRAVADHARALVEEGRKVVIWTIFTGTILEMEKMLNDLNPVSLYGAVPTGPGAGPEGREERLRRFHEDPTCGVLIANPAAAGEGISLHTVCHDAIYLDRSYVSTHFLQSIDRIHRLGLAPDVRTEIHIYETIAPPTIGSIDLSVRRRLATKIRGLQQLLDDPDLHEVALDEETAEDPIDYNVELQDLVDLVAELENRAPALDQE